MILPAVLETDPQKQIQRMESLAEYSRIIHTDIMDGIMVQRNNLQILNTLRTHSKADLELHLMVQEPAQLFVAIRKIKRTKRIVLQIESNWKPAFKKLKKYYTIGIALKPETPVSSLYNLPLKIREIKGVMNPNSPNPSYPKRGINHIDFIQLLSVTPGAQGNSFKPSVYRRVQEVQKLFSGIPIEIDGAMNPALIRKLKKIGVMDFVVGSYLKRGNIKEKMEKLQLF